MTSAPKRPTRPSRPRPKSKAKTAPAPKPPVEAAVAKTNPNPNGRDRNSAELLISLADGAELFHTPDGTCYADIEVNGHRETLDINRPGFRGWLTRLFYETTKGAPGGDAIQSAVNLLSAKAKFDAPERKIYLRVGSHGGRLYLDLANSPWEVVEIDATGWRIVQHPPVRFRREACAFH